MTDLFGRDLVDMAVRRLQAHEPPEGYYLAFSGGKDSCCIKALSDMAGVKYDAHYSVTTVDPPELLRFMRQHHANVIWDRPEKTMWQLIIDHGCPPTRLMRYCCEELKERGGAGRVVVTGLRWAESARRANSRKMVEACYKTQRTLVNPIIDWPDDLVWSFIRERGLAYCSLYDEGYKRLGCVMCPMHHPAGQRADAERWPGFYKAYMRAFGKMIERCAADGKPRTWQAAQDVMDWWLTPGAKATDPTEGQMGLFDEAAS